MPGNPENRRDETHREYPQANQERHAQVEPGCHRGKHNPDEKPDHTRQSTPADSIGRLSRHLNMQLRRILRMLHEVPIFVKYRHSRSSLCSLSKNEPTGSLLIIIPLLSVLTINLSSREVGRQPYRTSFPAFRRIYQQEYPSHRESCLQA